MTTMTLDIGNWTDGVLVDASVCTWLIRSEVLTSNCRDLNTRAKERLVYDIGYKAAIIIDTDTGVDDVGADNPIGI